MDGDIKNREKNRLREIGVDGIVSIIILIIVSPYLFKLKVPYLNTDEFGYWGSAAFFAGYDWSSVISPNSYFSYGYGIFLALILRFVKEPILCFKAAILLNAFFIIGLYLTLKKIIYILYENIEYKVCCLISIISTFYCTIITYSGITIPECLLSFLYSINVYLLLLFFKKPTWKKALGIISLSLYMYVVHQRMIVFLIVNVLFTIGYLYIKLDDNKIRTSIRFVFLLIFFCILFKEIEEIKKLLQREVWLIQESNVVISNDFSGQVSKVKYLLTHEGIREFVYCVGGRIFYLIVSTYGLIISFIISFMKIYRKKEISNNFKFLYYYLLLSMFGTIAVSCIFVYKPASTTYLFYGRYGDNIMPLIILILCLMIGNVSNKLFYISIFLINTLAILLKYRIDKVGLPNHNTSVSHVAMHIYYNEKGLNIFTCVLFVSLIFSLVFMILKYGRKEWIIIPGIIYMIGSIYVGYHATEIFYEEEQIADIEDALEIAYTIKELNIREVDVLVRDIEILGKKDKYGKIIQFVNPEIKIYIKNETEKCDSYFIKHNEGEKTNDEFTIIKENEKYMLAKYEKVGE